MKKLLSVLTLLTALALSAATIHQRVTMDGSLPPPVCSPQTCPPGQ